jgi:predicted nucleotide-binding protein (sugar kinase/HSP70/actin superfamily)
METWLTGTVGSRACPTVVGSADTTRAAFVKESDIFAQKGIKLVIPFVQMAERKLCKRQMFTYFKDILGLSEEENSRAVDEGFKAQDRSSSTTARTAGRSSSSSSATSGSAWCCSRARTTTTRA